MLEPTLFLLPGFALSSWKGKVATWIASQTPLRGLLRKALGEVTALIFEGNAEAAKFGLHVMSVEDEDPTVTSGALLKYAQMQVMQSAAEARFFCQTGLKGLGKAVGSALKTAIRSLARAEVDDARRQSNGRAYPSTPPHNFSEISSSVNALRKPYRHPAALFNANEQDFLPSFVSTRSLKTRRRFSGSAMALVGSTSGMNLKKALKKVKFQGKNIFADTNFLKRRWWSVLGEIVRRLRTKEKVALPLVILLSVHFFVISLSFAAVATVATQAIGAFCVLVVVLMMLDLLQLDASLSQLHKAYL